MDTGFGLGLLADDRIGPREIHIIEQAEHHSDLVLRGDGEELIEPLLQTLSVDLPHFEREIAANAVVSGLVSPPQFTIDGGRVKRVLLPPFEHVNRTAGHIVNPFYRADLVVPLPRFLLAPNLRLLLSRLRRKSHHKKTRQEHQYG